MDPDEALAILCTGNPLLHPVFDEDVRQALLAAGLARVVVGGGLKATDAGQKKYHGT